MMENKKIWIPRPKPEDYFSRLSYDSVLEYYEYITDLLKNQGIEITNDKE